MGLLSKPAFDRSYAEYSLPTAPTNLNAFLAQTPLPVGLRFLTNFPKSDAHLQVAIVRLTIAAQVETA